MLGKLVLAAAAALAALVAVVSGSPECAWPTTEAYTDAPVPCTYVEHLQRRAQPPFSAASCEGYQMAHGGAVWKATGGVWVRVGGSKRPSGGTAAPAAPPAGGTPPAAAGGGGKGAGKEFFVTPQGGITLGGKRVNIKGVNWSGFQTQTFAPDGLWATTLAKGLDFLQKNGFNALRLPFSAEMALGLDTIRVPREKVAAEPAFAAGGVTTGQAMDRVVQECKKRGILVLLDFHHLQAAGHDIKPLWYDATYPEAKVVDAWTKIAARYKDEPWVFAADLKNEPHGEATWGSGDRKTDWAAAAERMADALHKVNPRLLVFVEGIERPVDPGTQAWGWHGGVVAHAVTRPVRIKAKDKLAYAPHVYGPGTYAQPYFKDAAFPRNLDKVWRDHFGVVLEKKVGWLVFTEWGGTLKDADKVWADRLAKYFADNKLDTFWWTFNANSGDTGGLVKETDWTTPETHKLAVIAAAHPRPSKFVATADGGIALA